MKTCLSRTLAVASITLIVALTGYAQIIDSLPFAITKPGTYTLARDLTLSGSGRGRPAMTAITVEASNVVIDLGGFTLTGYSTPSGGLTDGIDNIVTGISRPITNVTIQNGTITGFDLGVAFDNTQFVCQNLSLPDNSSIGIAAGLCRFSTIKNCLIVSSSSTEGDHGIVLSECVGIVVKNNQIAHQSSGCFSSQQEGGNPSNSNSFIYNNIASCTIGLYLGSADKYQGNVTTNCQTPFEGGIAVGQENN
jgi:hypothetical protein